MWQLKIDALCELYKYPKKDSCDDNVMRQLFYAHASETHGDQFHIYTDGSKSEDGVGCSAVSLRGSRNMKLMTESSIFTAELCGILCGLQIVNATNRNQFVLFCDSRSALQVTEHYDSTPVSYTHLTLPTKRIV